MIANHHESTENCVKKEATEMWVDQQKWQEMNDKE